MGNKLIDNKRYLFYNFTMSIYLAKQSIITCMCVAFVSDVMWLVWLTETKYTFFYKKLSSEMSTQFL